MIFEKTIDFGPPINYNSRVAKKWPGSSVG